MIMDIFFKEIIMDIISRDNICQYNINYINFFLLLKNININILLISQNHTYSYVYKLII